MNKVTHPVPQTHTRGGGGGIARESDIMLLCGQVLRDRFSSVSNRCHVVGLPLNMLLLTSILFQGPLIRLTSERLVASSFFSIPTSESLLCPPIHLSNKCVPRIYYVTDTVLGSWNTMLNKRSKINNLLGLTG